MSGFEGDTPWNLDANSLSFEEVTKAGESRIILTGPRRSGKSSIERVVFHKMSPHETLFLESTHNVDVHLVSNNDLIRFQTWDFGGDLNLSGDVSYHDKLISTEDVLRSCNTLIYVIDAQEEDYEDALPKLVETIVRLTASIQEFISRCFFTKWMGISCLKRPKLSVSRGYSIM